MNGAINMDFNWQLLWELPLPPKLEVFLWRCLQGILPTQSNLNLRNWSPSLYCPCCCYVEESIDHVILQCPCAIDVWMVVKSELPYFFVPEEGVLEWFNSLMKEGGDLRIFLLVVI